MVVQVQVLGVASVEMAPSLMVSTETQRLMFNVGDGTQRMCMEHHVRLAKLRNVFLTELRTHTLGGLPGMILTISDTGKDALHVHGPEGTGQYIRATRHFLYRPNFKLEPHDLKPNESAKDLDHKPIYSDDELRVVAVPMRARAGHKRKIDETKALTEGANDAVSYIVETPEQRGKFLVEKAVALGVPKGAMFGQLHKGKDVTLPDGRIVRSADCVSASLPASGVAIIACPTVSFVEDLVASPIFHRYQAQDGKPPATQLQAVYHFGGASVLSHPQYLEWARKFGDDVDHVLLNHNGCAVKTVYRSSAKLQAQLHSVFPHAFPTNDYEKKDATSPLSRHAELAISSKPTVLGESMLKYTVVPLNRRGFDTTQCFEQLDFDELHTSMAPYREMNGASTSEKDPTITTELDGRITFLGTGCAIPSKYRNVTGNYLQFPKTGSPGVVNGVLLDCGEGSLGQLYRYTNGDVTKLRQLVQEVKFIWISHNHADHHLGIVRFLSFRSNEDNHKDDEPVLIIGPPPVHWWLKEYEQIDPTIAGKYTFVDNACFNEQDENFQDSFPIAKPTRVWLEDTLEITNFELVHVKHAFKAYAVVFTWKNALKIVFSGDCRPSDLLAEKASDAFLFIHEATFDDSMTTEAKNKDHSTTAEALGVGKKARAKHIVLTHFSQRYPKMPAAVEDDGTPNDSMSAMDLLSLRFSDLHTQAQLMEISLQILAKDDTEDADLDE